MVDVITLVKMYRDGHITDYSLCSEIQNNLKMQCRTNVYVGTDATATSPCSFLVSCLPIKTNTGYRLDIILDKRMLSGSAIKPEEISRMIEAVMAHGESVVFELNRELSKMKLIDLPLSDLIKLYLRIYKKSLSILPQDIVERANSAKIINARELDSYILSLEDSYPKVSEIIETIAIKDLMPIQFVDAAKALSTEVEKVTYAIDPDKVQSDTVNNSLIGVVTNPEKSDWEHKDLPHDYKPLTMY